MQKEKLLSIIDAILSKYEDDHSISIGQDTVEFIVSDIHYFIDDMSEKTFKKLVSGA